VSILAETESYQSATEVISAAIDYNRATQDDSIQHDWQYKKSLKEEVNKYIGGLEIQVQDYMTSEITNDAAVDLDAAIGKIRNLEKLSRVEN